MADDVKQTRPALAAEPAGNLRPIDTCEAGIPTALTAARADGGAGTPGPGEHCRECLAALAHRLAQTATALRGGVELGLLGKRSVADYRSILEQSLQLADRMVELIVALRDLAESGAPAGPSESVVLEDMVQEVQAELQGLADSREIRLQFAAEGPVKVATNPGRLRTALQSLFAWVIQNSAGRGVIETGITVLDAEAQVFLTPPRLDLQYLQVKALEDIASPGLLFSQATKNGSMGWAINRRLVEGLGGKLEIVTEGTEVGCIRARIPLASVP
jgi:light-regulated signal transduction histidine kinase (bacteriophytochrome)